MTKKGYKQTELGEIPEEWDVTRLENVSEKMKAGGTPSTKLIEYWNGNIPLVKVEDVVNASIYLNVTNLSITKEGLDNSSAWLVPKSSIIVTMYGTPGEVCINKIPVAVTQNVMGIIINDSIDLTFMYYVLKWAKTNTMQLIEDRTIFTHFSLTKVKKLIFPLPPLQEQKKIAHVLSTIQDSKEKTKQVIESLKTLKKSMMKHLFTYGPVSLEKAKKVILKQTELGEIPEGWEVKSIQELIDDKNIDSPLDGNHGALHPKKSDFVSKGIPFIMASDIHNGKVDILNCNYLTKDRADSLKKGFAKIGDVLISHKGTIGEVALVQPNGHPYIMLTPQVTYYRIINTKLLNNVYLYYYFQFEGFKNKFVEIASTGSTRAYIGITTQRSLSIFIPDIETQRHISSYLSNLDHKLISEQNKLSALDNLFKSKLNNLMTAKVRVNELNFEGLNV